MMSNSEARKRLAESPANEGGCVPCRVCGGDQSRGWHRHDSASERAAGELVADVDTLAAAIRRALDAGGFLVTQRDLAEALVAAGFGRIDAARREIAEAERRAQQAEAVADSMQHFADVAERLERKINEVYVPAIAAAEARGAQAVLDAVEAKSPCAAPDCRCTSRDEMRAAAREAARNAGAS